MTLFSSSTARKLGPLAFLVLVSALLYGRVASYDFVNWDDNYHVYKNPDILSVSPENAGRWLTKSYVNLWIPLPMLSYAVDHSLFGFRPGGYHATNLLLHLCSVLLVYFLLLRLTEDPALAWFSAALFAVHPAQAQTVAWISERKNLLCAFFLFGAALWALRPKKNTALCALFFIAAVLSKPTAAIAPLLAILYIWFYRKPAPAKTSKWLVPALGTAVVATAAALYFHPKTSALLFRRPLFETFSGGFLSYLRYWNIALWPAGLRLFYPKPDTLLLEPSTALRLGLTLLVFAVFTAALVFRKKQAFWFFCIAALLLPVSGFFGVPASDHQWYIPLAALAPLIYEVLCPFLSRKTILTLLGLLVLAMIPLTSQMLPAWKNSETFWLKTLSQDPSEDRALKQLAGYYAETGDTAKLTALYDRMLSRDPFRKDIYTEYATFAVRSGNLALAEKIEAAAQSNCPAAPETFYIHAMIAAAKGQSQNAAGFLEKSAALGSGNPVVYLNLTEMDLAGGKTAEAEKTAALFEKNVPGHAESFYLRGLIDLKKGKKADAEKNFREAEKRGSGNPMVFFWLGKLEFDAGRREKSVSYFEKTLALQPGFAAARRALAEARAR